jgi:hypothetical protein
MKSRWIYFLKCIQQFSIQCRVAIHVALVGNRRRHGAVPVGEALRLAQCWQARSWLLRALAVVDMGRQQQNTRPKQFTSTFTLCLITLDTLRHRSPYYSHS